MSNDTHINIPSALLKKLADEGILLILSQIGLGLAGFGGLISALRPSGQAWSLREIGAFSLLLEHALGLMLLALLPLVIRLFTNTERFAWQLSSAFLLLFLVVEILTQILRVIEYSKSGSPPRHPIAFVAVFVLFTGTTAGLAATNLRVGQAARFIICLYWILFSGTLQFFLLIRSTLGL